MEEVYKILAYKAPTDDSSLKLVTQLQSDLSALGHAARSEPVTLSPDWVKHHVNLARSRLRELKSIWGCVVDDADVSHDESRAAQNHVMRLFAVNHGCLPLLLAAHAWALRTSSPCCANQISGIGLLLMDLQFAIRVVLASKPLAPVDAPLLRTWENVLTAFLRTQPLHAFSAILHAHRQRLAACRGDAVSELAALGKAADAWTGALELAAFIVDVRNDSDSIESPITPSEVASSHVLQHLCALRLDLAEGLARAGDGEGTGEGEGEGQEVGSGAAVAAEGARVTKQLEGQDGALLKAIASASYAAQIEGPYVSVRERDLSVSVRLWTREPGSSKAVIRSALSHPAVQCLLGWWLVAPGAVAGGAGGRAWGLPEPLLRHVGDMGERVKLCVQALESAALCWEQVLRFWQDLPPSQRSGAAAAAAAQGSDREAVAALAGSASVAAPSMPPGAAAGTAILAPAGTPAGAHTNSISHELQHRPFPYSPLQIYRMCTAALRTCDSLAEQGFQPTRFHIAMLTPAVKDGMGVLIGSLLRMPPAQAARHLASAWQVLLQCPTAGIEIHSSTLGLCMARLLGELPPRLQQQQQGQEQQQEQQQQGREDGGLLLSQQQQHSQQGTNAGGGERATGDEATGSGATVGRSSSDGGEGAAAAGERPMCAPLCAPCHRPCPCRISVSP